mmetsp:Transcript_45135/g.128902  ORF Transcript_45135/g.128902 Transcript_45135/m.128902 type:complete len:633 (+) Transcript_45135:88-1986(+)
MGQQGSVPRGWNACMAPAVSGDRRGSHGQIIEDNMVVHVEEVIAKKGSIPVSGRYTRSRKLEQDYSISERVLGSGLNGPVLLAVGQNDGRKYAVKTFKKRGLNSKHREELKNEAELYLMLDHPHVAHLEMVYETSDILHLVMEFMAGGELYDRLSAERHYTEERAADTVYQMLLAVAYLHAANIAHRDLKLENFLYESPNSEHLKLIDFGFAKFWDSGTVMSQACGSVHYVAPEVLRHSYTVQADMWSLGIISYMLLTGVPAFHGTDNEILAKIRAGRPYYSSKFMRLSSLAQGFVKELLVKDPTKRMTAAKALEHPWIKSRHQAKQARLDADILVSLRKYGQVSHFRRAVLWMMAWSLSTEDQVDLREQFLLLDTQKRGTITLKELKSVLEKSFHVEGKEAEDLFNSLDFDGSGEIQYTEFLAHALLGRIKAHEDVLRKTFMRFDRDESGKISTDELHDILGESFDHADIETVMRQVDTSGDGMIDYNEFIAYILQKPERALEGGKDSQPLAADRGSSRKRLTEKLGAVVDRLLGERRTPSKESTRAPSKDRATSSTKSSSATSSSKSSVRAPSKVKATSSTNSSSLQAAVDSTQTKPRRRFSRPVISYPTLLITKTAGAGKEDTVNRHSV